MKNAFLLIALIVLLAASAAGLYVINDPAPVLQLIKKPGTVTASASPVGKPSTAKSAGSATSGSAAAPAPADFDRKATSSSEARRPPKKSELAQASGNTELRGIDVQRKGRPVGVLSQPTSTEAPPSEFYPFTIVRRTFPDAGSITVELAIKNASGSHWKTAYVALRSSRVKEIFQFEIQDWQIDETVGIDYTFPRAEIQDRLTDLRVVSVSGEKRESALAERMQASRRKYVESSATKRGGKGDTLTASGLIGVFGRMQSPVTGIQVRTAEFRSMDSKPVAIAIPQDSKLPADLVMGLRETSEERKAVIELAQKFHQAAVAAESGLGGFARELGKEPYDKAIRGSAGTALAQARERLAAFNVAGVELATKVQISSDPDIKKVGAVVPDYSKRILAQVESIENQMQGVDPSFRVMKNP